MKSPLLSNLDSIQHEFGTREHPIADWADDIPEIRQIHGNQCKEVKTSEDAEECDALYTRTPGLPIAIRTADCVPILISHKDALCVAAVHSGWKGTSENILRSTWNEISKIDPDPKNWIAANWGSAPGDKWPKFEK